VLCKNWKKYTLKLDAAWQPLEIVDSFKAFNMCLTDRAKMVINYDDGFPSVIVLNKYVRRYNFSLTCNRKNVFWRDDNQCQYCSQFFKYTELTMDHVKPKSLGGPKTWENIVTSCKACNTKKKNRTPKQAKMPLLRRPFSPRVRMMDLYRNIEIEEEWEQFL
jgi:hypothetical protein